MQRILVLGSNRGIGLELVRQLVERGDEVIAGCRSSSPELEAIAPFAIEQEIDVTAPSALDALAARLGDSSIDWLVVVAGVLERVSLDRFDPEVVRRQFEVNALGPLQAVVTLQLCVRRGGKIGLLTSRMGSIADNTSGGSYGYRMSKAALNMASRSLALDLGGREIAVAVLHPGWVRTDMTQGTGHISASESAEGLVARMDELTLQGSGRFFHQNGDELPW